MNLSILKSKNILLYLYLFGIGLMIASLPLSKYIMSVAQFVLGGTVLLEFYKASAFISILKKRPPEARIVLALPLALFLFIEAFVSVFRKFLRKENLPAIVLSSIYLLHLAGLAHTSDYEYALKDLRIKLPILILPIIFSVSEPLNDRRFRAMLGLFVAAVVAGTLICTAILIKGEYIDIRDISIFISHIRFSLLIAFAVFILAWFIFGKERYALLWKVIFTGIAIWLVVYLIISASFTGLSILIITSFFLLLGYIFRKGKLYLKASVIGLFIIVLVGGFFYVRNIWQDVNLVHPVDTETLDKYSAAGNIYWHDYSSDETENGYYVWLYVADNELKETWNQRSGIDYEGLDKNGQILKFTLIRYMTSKGLRKDAEGLKQMSDADIGHVEDGIASVVYHENPPVYVRIYKTIWAYNRYQVTGNASGNSLLQRLEYWKASLGIIRGNLIYGVGTGDLPGAFESQYNQMN
ncbi:MAG: hypothetical protein KKA81_08085, partial [Bacteroidetes bacterium]|nr:hypothetical protein [Bacteroidota bacterium]